MKDVVFAAISVALGGLVALTGLAGLPSVQPAAAEPPVGLAASITLYPMADAWINYYLPNNNFGTGACTICQVKLPCVDRSGGEADAEPMSLPSDHS